MKPRLQRLNDTIEKVLGLKPIERIGELTLEVNAGEYRAVAQTLRDHADLRFDELIDLCGVDYSTYGDRPRERERFAAVLHLLSVEHNWRLRVRVFCPNDEFPLLPSVIEVWPGVNWF